MKSPKADFREAMRGEYDEARELLEQSLLLYRTLGDKERLGWVLYLQARLLFLSGRDRAAAHSLTEQSLTLLEEIDNPTEALVGLASVAAMQGDFVAARELYQESFTVLQRIQYQQLIAPCLEGLAATVTAAQDELGWALHLWGAAEALREATGTPIPPVHRLEYTRAVEQARAQLGNETFSRVWAEGRTLTPRQAMADHPTQ